VDYYGYRLRVEIAKGRGAAARATGPRDFRAPNTGYRVIVKGLPRTASWQDLKDHFRQVARPAYTNVLHERDGPVGIVEFENGDDMDKAVRRLDDSEFKNIYDRCFIRLIVDRPGGGEDWGGGGRGRSPPRRGRARSRSRSRSRSRERSPPRGRSPPRPRSRNGSPVQDRRDMRSASSSPAPSPRRGRSPARD
jgi:arginine/serine-rich splicing factor 1/9